MIARGNGHRLSTHPSRRTSPTSGMSLYEGAFVLTLDGAEHSLTGVISQEWLPEPRVRFQGTVSSMVISLGSGEGTITVGSHLKAAPVFVTRADNNIGQGSRISGFLNKHAHWNEPPTGEIPNLNFALTNFHSYIGSPVSRGSGFSRARLSFSAQGWTITIDEVQNWRELKKELQELGGFAISHGGLVDKESGAIAIKDVSEIQSILGFFFSFMRGFWCGPVFPSTYGSDGYVLLTGGLLNSRWRNFRSWFPERPGIELDSSFGRFLDLWNDEKWNEPLRHAIWWYVEANDAQSQESSIVMSQAALELLGWVILVETRQVLSADGFERLPAADKIRLLLTQFNIPVSIAGIPELESFAATFDQPDGPGIYTFIRNSLVHPSQKKREYMAQAKREAKWAARHLGLQYIELVILGLLGYRGDYRDRTDLERMAYKKVPWAA